MSAGHGHPRPNLRHPTELKKLLDRPDVDELMQRWQDVDLDHDINDLAGYNVQGTVRYLDQDFVRAILDPDYAEQIGVEIDTGLSPEDTIECVLEHEAIEKVLLEADNDIDTYEPAHEFATVGEHELVRSKTGTDGKAGRPLKYERGLKQIIQFCARKVPKKVPPDLACAPLLDEPDKNDTRVLKAYRKLGVTDADKVSKASVDYGKSTGSDQCARCEMWQGDRAAVMSPCSLVNGLVRADRVCSKFEEETDAEDGADQAERHPPDDGGDGELPAAEGPAQPVRHAPDLEDPGDDQESGPASFGRDPDAGGGAPPA